MRLAGLCTTRQFWHGASRSEARIPYGPPARGWKMMGFAVYNLFSTRRVLLRGMVACDKTLVVATCRAGAVGEGGW